jgi:hypothetical protein
MVKMLFYSKTIKRRAFEAAKRSSDAGYLSKLSGAYSLKCLSAVLFSLVESKCLCYLIGTRRVLEAATNSVKTRDSLVYRHIAKQRSDALSVSRATAREFNESDPVAVKDKLDLS